jgi:FimV-like protein
MISIIIKRAIYLLGFTSIFLSVNAQAIALGKIQLYSTQQQSLQLQVDLVEAEGVLPNSMVARVAGPAQFLAANLPYLEWYAQLDVKVVEKDGNYVIEVFGQQPVEQEQLDFIFEVDYLGGRLLAEYAVTLPTFGTAQKPAEQPSEPQAPEPQVLVKAIEAGVILEEAVAQLVASQNATPELEPVVAIPAVVVVADAAAVPTVVVVKPGQTLWRIAVNNTPAGTSPWQTLMGLYRANPEAYKNGDIRLLMSNSRLRLPTQEEVNLLNVDQAKAAYQALVPTPVKAIKPAPAKPVPVKPVPVKPVIAKPAPVKPAPVKPAPVKPIPVKPIPVKPDPAKLIAEQQLKNEQDKIKVLAGQSQVLEAEVKGLQADYNSALSQQEMLSKTSKNLAQGVAVQEQDIKNLNAQRAQLENNMLSLDQQFESTQAYLNQAEQKLASAKQELTVTQGKIGLATQVKGLNDRGQQVAEWINVTKMAAFLLVPVLLVIGLIWWIIGRGKKRVAQHVAPEITDEEDITLDPLADYDTKPSVKAADLHQSAKKMQGGMPERSFIEELLQQQEADEAQLTRQGFSSEIEDDQVHLSTDIEAMLNGQRQMDNQADEPVEYLSHEEEMNTKLDLALSYRDMGEVSQTQTILQEVLQQGNAQQKAQARALLSSINKA